MDLCHSLVLLTSIFHITQGGSCWHRRTSTGGCRQLISINMTSEECCQRSADGPKYYSAPQLSSFMFRIISEQDPDAHLCTPACQNATPDCSTWTTECGENEKCVVRNGEPRCICSPHCAAYNTARQFRGPFCGSDGETYRSHCQLLKQNCRNNREVTIAYPGRCKAYSCDGVQCHAKDHYCITDQFNKPMCLAARLSCRGSTPICGTDGQTYNSICYMTQHNMVNNQQVRKRHNGPCSITSSCEADSGCTNCLSYGTSSVCYGECPTCSSGETNPVCGMDGITYPGECQLKATTCRQGNYVRVLHIGSCDATEEEISGYRL